MMHTHAREHDSHEVFQTMHDQHVRMSSMLSDMQKLVTGDDRDAMRAAWAKLENAVLEHLKLEELHFVPAIAKRDASTAQAVHTEHDAIRASIAEIGMELDLHTARAESIERLAEALRAHALREEERLYPAAEETLTPAAKDSVFKRVRELLIGVTTF